MSIVLKIRKDGDIRRTTVPRGTSFQDLQKLTAQLFQLQTFFVLKYRDQENDLITISNDIELNESFESYKDGKPLNLEIHSSPNSAPATSQPDQQPINSEGFKFFENLVQQYQPLVNDFLQQLQNQAIFNQNFNPNNNSSQSSNNNNTEELPIHNAFCDACQEQIVGWRFKCQSCPDFDLCQLCVGKNDVHNPSHEFSTLEKPEKTFGGNCRRFYHPYATSNSCQWQ